MNIDQVLAEMLQVIRERRNAAGLPEDR
jgi:hypothetical protein